MTSTSNADLQTRQELAECSIQHAGATVISPESGIISLGQFQRINGSAVTIRFGHGALPLLSESLHVISFSLRGRPCVFYSTALDVEDHVHRDVTFAIPDQLCFGERRRWRRQTLRLYGDIFAELHDGGDIYQVSIPDLSLGGAMITFSNDEMPNLTPGHTAAINMTSQYGEVWIPSRIVRRTNHGYGIAFEQESGQKWKSYIGHLLGKHQLTWSTQMALTQFNADRIPEDNTTVWSRSVDDLIEPSAQTH